MFNRQRGCRVRPIRLVAIFLGCFLLFLSPLVFVANAVELPRLEVSTRAPVITGRTIQVGVGDDLNAAIRAAQPGDQIVLKAGTVFRGSYILPNKQGDGWVTIRSSGALPAESVRATAADAGAMATLMAPEGNSPALQTAKGAHHYRLVGLNITAASGITRLTSLVNLGDTNTTSNAFGEQPHDIVIDRSFIHGSEMLDLRRGVTLNSGASAIINSTISEVHSADADSQAIVGWNGTGPYLIENNNLQASGENVMFGGADPSVPDLLPSDITIRGNDFQKPESWKGVWEVKNLLELKLGARVLIENNTFSGTWADAQAGFALNLKSSDQNGRAPWSNTSNVMVRNNTIRNAPSGISLSASPDPGATIPMSDIAITGNVFEHIGGKAGAPAGALILLAGYGGSLRNIVFEDNIALVGNETLETVFSFDGEPTRNLVLTGNTLSKGLYGIKGSGASDGAGTLAIFAPGAVFRDNILIGWNSEDYGEFAALNAFKPAPGVLP